MPGGAHRSQIATLKLGLRRNFLVVRAQSLESGIGHATLRVQARRVAPLHSCKALEFYWASKLFCSLLRLHPSLGSATDA